MVLWTTAPRPPPNSKTRLRAGFDLDAFVSSKSVAISMNFYIEFANNPLKLSAQE